MEIDAPSVRHAETPHGMGNLICLLHCRIRIAAWIVLVGTFPMLGQDSPPAADSASDTSRQIAGLGQHFGAFKSPIVATYAIARLGNLICARDQQAGATLLREAFDRLGKIPLDAFDESTTLLPVLSFGGLWKVVVPPLRSCDKEKAWNDALIEERRILESRKANVWLRTASSSHNAERSAQMIEAALSVVSDPSKILQRAESEVSAQKERTPEGSDLKFSVNPNLLDLRAAIDDVQRLRDARPDLSDKLFSKTLSYLRSGPPLLPSEFSELERYLFSPEGSLRATATVGLVVEYVHAVAESLDSNSPVGIDPKGAYALTARLLGIAQALAPESVSTLNAWYGMLEAQVAGNKESSASRLPLPNTVCLKAMPGSFPLSGLT